MSDRTIAQLRAHATTLMLATHVETAMHTEAACAIHQLANLAQKIENDSKAAKLMMRELSPILDALEMHDAAKVSEAVNEWIAKR